MQVKIFLIEEFKTDSSTEWWWVYYIYLCRFYRVFQKSPRTYRIHSLSMSLHTNPNRFFCAYCNESWKWPSWTYNRDDWLLLLSLSRLLSISRVTNAIFFTGTQRLLAHSCKLVIHINMYRQICSMHSHNINI